MSSFSSSSSSSASTSKCASVDPCPGFMLEGENLRPRHRMFKAPWLFNFPAGNTALSKQLRNVDMARAKAHSQMCTGQSVLAEGYHDPCINCCKLVKELSTAASTTSQDFSRTGQGSGVSHTNWSMQQAMQKLDNFRQTSSDQRLERLGLQRQLASARRQMSTHVDILWHLQNAKPYHAQELLRRYLYQSSANGTSMFQLVQQLARSAAGTHKPRFGSDSLPSWIVAWLTFVGSGRVANAFCKVFGFPGSRTAVSHFGEKIAYSHFADVTATASDVAHNVALAFSSKC